MRATSSRLPTQRQRARKGDTAALEFTTAMHGILPPLPPECKRCVKEAITQSVNKRTALAARTGT